VSYVSSPVMPTTYDAGPAVQIGNQSIGTTARDLSANVIAYNAKDGIRLASGGTGIMRGNSIFSNSQLGIGYTTVPSSVQTPTIQSVTASGSTTTISFQVPYSVAADNEIDFYASPAGSSDQGTTYLGSMAVLTTASGANVFTFTTSQPLKTGEIFTATNTLVVTGNGAAYQQTTSPFSTAYVVPA